MEFMGCRKVWGPFSDMANGLLVPHKFHKNSFFKFKSAELRTAEQLKAEYARLRQKAEFIGLRKNNKDPTMFNFQA